MQLEIGHVAVHSKEIYSSENNGKNIKGLVYSWAFVEEKIVTSCVHLEIGHVAI